MESSGANSDDVSVWELAGLLFANRSELCVVVYTRKNGRATWEHDISICKLLRMSTLNSLEQHFRVKATFGANIDDVPVWEHGVFLLVVSAVDLSSVS